MSFILDALRKSENERRQDAVPSISRVPLALPRHRLPLWALTVMFALCAALLAVGGAWWRSLPSQRPDSMPASAQGGVPEKELTRSEPLAAASAPRETEPAPVAEPTPATSANVSAPARAPVTIPSQLPTMTELAARGISLPRLRLELHVFSENPSQRFAFINAVKYREGETLSEGPRVLAITAEGVVLAYQGREFLLARE